MRRVLSLRCSTALTVTLMFAVPGPAIAQVAAAPLTTATVGCITDKVQLTSFTKSPAQPTYGQQVTLTLALKNVCSGTSPQNVPWRVTLGTTTIGSGTVPNLAAGATANVTATWTATAGTHNFDAEADPNNTLNEAATGRANNLPTGFSLTVPCGADRVQLTNFTMVPTQPQHGQQVTLTMTVKNICTGSSAQAVPWAITVGTTAVGSGTIPGLAGGAAATATANWTAYVGTHSVDAEADPNNTMNESAAARANNLPQGFVVTVNPDWGGWGTKARTATTHAVVKWFQGAAIKDVEINAAMARGGRLEGPSMEQLLKSALTDLAVPADVADGFAKGFHDAWSSWVGSVRVPLLPWYPTFASTAIRDNTIGSNAPGTNLRALEQNSGQMSSGTIAPNIKTRLGGLASTAGAGAAVDAFAGWAAGCFSSMSNAAVMGVEGKGTNPATPGVGPLGVPIPVPGPVVNGRGNGRAGHISVGFC